VWWNNEADAPYEWGLVDRARDGRIALYLLRMTSDGGFWRPFQWPGRGPEMGRAYEAAWVDFNGDGRPELKTWERAKPDSLFTECPGCPQRLIERTYGERLREGFVLSEQRFLPTPYATFTEFVRSLVVRNRTAALGCVSRPELVDQAQKLGWGSRKADGTWAVERTEQEPWPRWLALRFASANGPRRYVVRFTEKEGRWLIEGWSTEASGASATEPKP
jgi:hypothetical protein